MEHPNKKYVPLYAECDYRTNSHSHPEFRPEHMKLGSELLFMVLAIHTIEILNFFINNKE